MSPKKNLETAAAAAVSDEPTIEDKPKTKKKSKSSTPDKKDYEKFNFVVPGYDRFHRRGTPGGTTRMWGHDFTLMENGDATIVLPDYCYQDYLDAGRGIAIEDHTPLAPATGDEIERASRPAGSVVNV